MTPSIVAPSRPVAPALRQPAGPPPAASDADVLAQILQPAAAAPAPRIDPAALAAFVDGVVHAYMTEKAIAGATVAVVDRDGPLLLRGYGAASLHPRRAVDPASTLFRIGSISKTFTYVATMQLVAAGKLDLDAPVDRYLPPSLKTADSRYPPVRVWHLMTHTAGFEDATLGAHLFHKSPAGVPALDTYLATDRPKRVRSPAIHADYSNYSVVLLGAIVQQVSGEPFDAYIERQILTPLDMAHTTFREPLPQGDPRTVGAALKMDFSSAFAYEQGGFADHGFEYISNGAPAGAGSSDAADMAIWMRMLLGGGTVDGHEILDPIAFREMTTPTWSNAPAVHAIAHGFFVGRYGRYSSLEHGGDTIWFHS
ncbi:MAG: serine hydrolase domain-containing protein, partial [Rhodanobacteraceae bacterium]